MLKLRNSSIAPGAVSRWAGLVFAVLALSACGSPARQAQSLMASHVLCAPASFHVAGWAASAGSEPGGSIFYLTDTGKPAELHVMSALGKDDRLLAADAQDPLPSPDGSLVAFQRAAPGNGQAFDTYVVDVSSGKVRKALPYVQGVTWSPDSRWLLYSAPPQTPGPIYKTDARTGQTVQLTDTTAEGSFIDTFPIWSPDGQWIAFASSRGNGYYTTSWVYLMKADGTDIHQLAGPDQPVCAANIQDLGSIPYQWLPGGKNLVYVRNCDWKQTLYSISPDGKSVTSLNGLGPDTIDQQWSPDGSRILYALTGSQSALYIADAGGSNRRQLHTEAYDGRWSPDGSQIAFVGVDSAGLSEIDTIRPDGSGLTQLTNNPGGDVCLH